MVEPDQRAQAESGPVRPPVIMLVDDDEYVRLTVRSILRHVGARFVEASTASEAIDIAASESPTLAIVDLGLPDRDGLKLIAELRAGAGPDRLGIIVLTGQVPDQGALRAAGADALLLKPFRLHELRETVRAELAARSGARAG